ncbi:hypothetical protein [uncultured Methylibium sp.]|uniref:hypothetical protein n=1 Tax=uncultured Methylibium sp. TaxID=381093 RepID=UPI0025E519B7|nr:hypothetical protein [uncultured Methylibium sp.]
MEESGPTATASGLRRVAAGLVAALRQVLRASRLAVALAYALATLLVLWPIAWVGQALNWALARPAPWIGIAAVVVAAVALLVYAALMTNEDVLRALPQQGIAFPTSLSVALAAFAVVVFGALSCACERLDWISMQPAVPHAEGCATRYADLYLWHLFDAIPGIRFTETVGWAQKYSYTGALAGWLLVGFKLLVIVCVIGSFVVCGRLRSEARAAALRQLDET